MIGMDLTEDQKTTLCKWIEEGQTLSDIQKNILRDWEQSLTYMQVRFLVDDLGFTLKNKAPSQDIPKTPIPDAPDTGLNGQIPTSVEVAIDPVKKPGAMVNGSVTFRDGVTCQWQVDSFGRLGIVPSQEGYQPTPQDIQDFQLALQSKLQGL